MATKTEPTTEAGGFDLSREGGEGWKPSKGDKLVGPVVTVGSRYSDWSNGFYPMLIVSAEDGSTQDGKPIPPGTQVAFHAFHSIAFRRILDIKPLEGERIGIMYHGSEPTADGKRKAELYTVKVDREKGQGPDPYAGLRAPGGKDVKAEGKVARDTDIDDKELDEILS